MAEHKRLARIIPKQLRYLSLATAISLFLVIVLGGIVRVSGSGGCPDWPTCFNSWLPPVDHSASIDYLHRLGTIVSAVLLALSAWTAWHRYRTQPWISYPIVAAFGMMAAQIGFGAALTVNGGPGGGLSTAFHLGISLGILGLALVGTIVAFYFEQSEPSRQGSFPTTSLTWRSPFARLSLVVFGMAFWLLVSGTTVTATASTTVCTIWPMCTSFSLPASAAEAVNLIHRLWVLLTGVVMVIWFFRAWRTQRTQTAVLVATTAGFVLYFSQALLGARMATDYPAYLLGLHLATAVAFWAALVTQVVCTGLAARNQEDERLEAQSIVGRRGLWRDLLMLTKPIVVALLLVTTFAGMVIGGQQWPSLGLVFWTLLGGFMAAGGSGAINQFIDRIDDGKMQRTQKRPIPAGRMTPGEGLAFGVGMALASFYVMTAFVNFLAAMLTLAGIFYYVLIYSIFLKKATVQNIVIGGGAGAIPPLVGWAAATGSLNVPSLFLFAVVFMWTPPHFWALALVRRKDYARAGVPMLPVIRGEKVTRWQIFLYTLELVGLTLLLPLFGLGGSIYLIGAVLLGLWLLYAAWKVWKLGGNKEAWKMYRYSSMYLAFIFMVLMVDRLM
jgi:heme o synthase